MIVYLYDKNTGEYLSEYSPQINPKNTNEYLYPANSTLIKPESKVGFTPVFDGEKWIQIRDFRGLEIINTDTLEITSVTDLGELPDGYILYDEFKSTDKYARMQQAENKKSKEEELLAKLAELDLKRIRAICEPETTEDGQSWLEFYNSQVIELRTQLQEL